MLLKQICVHMRKTDIEKIIRERNPNDIDELNQILREEMQQHNLCRSKLWKNCTSIRLQGKWPSLIRSPCWQILVARRARLVFTLINTLPLSLCSWKKYLHRIGPPRSSTWPVATSPVFSAASRYGGGWLSWRKKAISSIMKRMSFGRAKYWSSCSEYRRWRDRYKFFTSGWSPHVLF